MEIKGSVVLVTGGGNGIGEAVAKYFAKQGAKIAIVDMVQKNIDRVVADLKAMGAEAIGVQANVTSEAETAKFVQATVAAFGKRSFGEDGGRPDQPGGPQLPRGRLRGKARPARRRRNQSRQRW